MEARISLVTLGVADVGRAVAFYRDGLGLPMSSASVEGEVAFFRMGGAVLSLWRRAAFAEDIGVAEEGSGFRAVGLAHNVDTPEMVDATLAEAARAGGTIVKPAGEAIFGRQGCFTDPDGHLWEVAWNPSFPFAEDGSLILPE
jgi:catechol 2,3-dioxygenase-like lactoylglutathione lyase family enzyme